jgi:hypothetical protein
VHTAVGDQLSPASVRLRKSSLLCFAKATNTANHVSLFTIFLCVLVTHFHCAMSY